MTRKTGTSTRDGEDDDEEPVNRRWPEEFDIPTPTFPFPNSTMKIASEELSRQNLLKKTPHMDESPSTPVRRLYKLAGVRTTEMDLFNNIMEMKKMFRVTENKLRVYYENEIGKWDWDTLKRFRCKLNGIHPFPVYQWTIAVMRLNQDHPKMPKKPGAAAAKKNSEEEEDIEKALKQKRPALWYTQLKGEAEMNGATRHNGCHTELQKLLKYCDVDMKTKPHMLNRLALLAVSLPATELGTKHWQRAIVVCDKIENIYCKGVIITKSCSYRTKNLWGFFIALTLVSVGTHVWSSTRSYSWLVEVSRHSLSTVEKLFWRQNDSYRFRCV